MKKLAIKEYTRTLGSNTFEIEEDHYAIVLPCGSKTKIDKEDGSRVLGFRWNRSGNGYCMRDGREYLHSFLMGKKPGFVIDHANRVKLDNRKSNLRFVTLSENGMNRRQWKSKNTVTGVYRKNDGGGEFQVSLTINGKAKAFGRFHSKEAAESAAKKLKNQYYGEHSPHHLGEDKCPLP